jgi:hypothetical protein
MLELPEHSHLKHSGAGESNAATDIIFSIFRS